MSNYKIVKDESSEEVTIQFYCDKCGDKLNTVFRGKNLDITKPGQCLCDKHGSHLGIREMLNNWAANFKAEDTINVYHGFTDGHPDVLLGEDTIPVATMIYMGSPENLKDEQ